jgi:hypothetical protein
MSTFVVVILMLLVGCSASIARPRTTVMRHGYGATSRYYDLAPEAAALKAAQPNWPNVPLCDDGGYRIRPCSLGGG